MANKIDILLPYWGDFSLFKETVDSVIAQTSTEWRLIISDDHYPSDEAQKYIRSLKNPRIDYYRQEVNIGITNNFNYCIDKAKASYCVLIGCDDRMLPDYVETALQNIGDADFYQPGVQIIDALGNVYLPLTDRIKRLLMPKKSGNLSGESLAKSLCHGNWLYFPSIVWKTSTIKKHKFDTKYKIAEDLVAELNIVLDGGILCYDKSVTFQYRRFAQSLSSKEKGKGGIRFAEEREVYGLFADKFAVNGWIGAKKAARLRLTSRINEFLSR